MRSPLARLLRPRSIAVVGGGSWCRQVIANCRNSGFDGAIWPVHPTLREVEGFSAVASVVDLPAPPDAVFVGVNRTASIAVVRDLSALGAGGAVCYAAGFKEAAAECGEGEVLQAELLEAAGAMRLIGPNCYGMLNFLDGAALWPDHHGGQRVERGVAVITQSSNIALNITMQRRGLPLAHVVTVGNQAQTGLSEIGAALLEDDRVTALGLHIEGVDDLRAFEALAARARKLGKPVVALKVGVSEQARAATISHTASLAGNAAAASALLERLGIGQVSSLSALLETLKLLHATGPLTSERIASLSCSGGEASLIADLAYPTGLQFPALTETQTEKLRAALGPMVALANPLDYQTYVWGDEAALSRVFAAMADPTLAMVVVLLDFPRLDRCSAHEWDAVIRALASTVRCSDVPFGIVSSLPENLPEEVATTLVDLGLTPFCGLSEAIEAMDVASRMSLHDPPSALHLPAVAARHRVLSEAEAKHLLSAFGVRVPLGRRAKTPESAGIAAQSIGFPVVLKGEGLAHKTEAGAVVLPLHRAEDVARAARSMPAERFLVEEMIPDAVAELLVGVVRDPAHGMLLTLAAGGILTEILNDTASLLLPVREREVRDALGGLRIASLLRGYRGGAAAGMDSVIATILAVQDCVLASAVEEVEINPLICTPVGAIAADALIRIGDSHD